MRPYVTWYNRPRKFDNGVVWFRIVIRERWCFKPGLWFSRHRPWFRLLWWNR